MTTVCLPKNENTTSLRKFSTHKNVSDENLWQSGWIDADSSVVHERYTL